MITVVIDSDPMVYAAGFAVQHTFYDVLTKNGKLVKTFEGKKKLNAWLEENEKKASDFVIESKHETEPLQHATHILDTQLSSIMQYFQAEQSILYLTDDRRGFNFRDYLAMQRKYKDRPANNRPVYYKALREYLVSEYGAVVVTGFEADDAVAMQAYSSNYYEDTEVVIVSIDKDLRMVPGRHYNPDKKQLSDVSAREGMHNFFMQLLTGDTTDTIPGVPRVGPKKAEKLYEDCCTEAEYFAVALDQYRKVYGEACLSTIFEQGRLLYMLRYAGDVWLGPEGKYLKDM